MNELEVTNKPALFKPNPEQRQQAAMEVATTRAAQEIQAAMVVAKRFPRDVFASIDRIKQACKRTQLAEVSTYAYPKGGKVVTGPSIRMAECLAQNWGNVDFGIIELEQHHGESTVMAYAWDLETNARQTKVFTVAHKHKSGGGYRELVDPREIYELVANQGARRLRACILGVIPGDIVDTALDECEKTLSTQGGAPLIDRVRKMVAAFSEVGVSSDMIAERLGHKLEVTTEQELVNLRKIYMSLRDGMGKREDWFKLSLTKPDFGDKPEQPEETPPPKKRGRPKKVAAPEPEVTQPPAEEEPPPPPAKAKRPVLSVQAELEQVMEQAGVSFHRLHSWLVLNDWIDPGKAYEGYGELDVNLSKKILNLKEEITNELGEGELL